MAHSPKRNLALLACSLFCSTSFAANIPAKDRTVIVISIDGMPGWIWQDPKLSVPHLQTLVKDGVRAEGMISVNPTVTWPNHTAMVTGVTPAKHGVIYNGLSVRLGDGKPLKLEPWRPKQEMVLVPTVYDKAFAAGLTTAQVDWVAITDPKTITYPFTEVPDPDGKVEREMAEAGLLSKTDAESFRKSNPAWRDEIWTQAAIHIIRKHKPNLLLFHLLNTDSMNHGAGPRSNAGYAGYSLADAHVGDLLRALKDAGMEDRATIFVVSDHGFKTAKKIIKPNALFRSKGWLRGDAPDLSCDLYAIPEGGTAMIYVTNPSKRDELLPKAIEALRGVEGVEAIIQPKEYSKYGYPAVEPGGRMADFVLAAGDGYAFGGGNSGDPVSPVGPENNPGNHGYLNTDLEMRATFLAWGYGIKKGARIGTVNAVDLAPTLAHFLGVDLGPTDGRLLTEILAK